MPQLLVGYAGSEETGAILLVRKKQDMLVLRMQVRIEREKEQPWAQL